MATVYSLPGSEAPAPQPAHAPAIPLRRRTEIDVAAVAARLKMSDRPLRAIVTVIRLLVLKHGFPEPASPRFVKQVRQRGGAAVWSRSKWNRDDVDQWFDDDLPPAAAARAARVNRDEVRAELAGRAGRLVA